MCEPDGSSRRSAGRDSAPLRTTTFITRSLRVDRLRGKQVPPYGGGVTEFGGTSAEVGDALGHVGEGRVSVPDATEQGAGPRCVAGPVVEVGERVPLAEVVVPHHSG